MLSWFAGCGPGGSLRNVHYRTFSCYFAGRNCRVPMLSGFGLVRSQAGYLAYIKGKGKGRKGLAFARGKPGRFACPGRLPIIIWAHGHAHAREAIKRRKADPPGGVEQCGMDVYPPLATYVTNPSKFFSPLKGCLWFRLSERNKYPIG